MKYSVIIPIYNEEDNIKSCIDKVRKINAEVEIIIVDGQSTDNSYNICKTSGYNVVRAPKGRGLQLNEGAKHAQGDILLFLHADTLLPVDAFEQIHKQFDDPNVQISTFRMLFDRNHWILKLYAFFTRFDTILTSFGDQCIVVRKDFFQNLGSFPVWPLFEDVHFFRTARRKTKVYSMSGPVITSARKYLKEGLIRRQIFNGILILKYLLGVSPQKLYLEYYHEK